MPCLIRLGELLPPRPTLRLCTNLHKQHNSGLKGLVLILVVVQNRTIENPIIRDKVTFVRTAEETGGAVSEIIVEVSVGGGKEPHYHTMFAESFTPIEGELGVLVGKEKRTLRTGEPTLNHCLVL